ncbi:cation diffusion facilitator family transporter [Paenibacillus senegalensis]|uniref:cation diffusion facilitator family transporter n=1 Tax=Paenibacillus senegalensis TaxID=1465766 RepID=UPI00028A3EC6|nr:cation diffusion facilitator family transporter [Paenibacillus senegalensis]
MVDYENIKQGEKGAWLSIISYLVLAAVKLTIGYMAYSEALMADGFNNTTDIVACIAVLIGLKISRRPPDSDHPYGHFRAETIASLIASFIMAAVGLQVLVQAVRSTFFGGEAEAPNMLAAWVALGGALVMFFVYRYNLNLSRKINSGALNAAAQDNKSDALVSIGAFVGIIGAQFGLIWLDPLAAAAVGVVILKTAWDIFREASHTLTDGFHEHDLKEYKKTVRGTPGVLSIKEIKARKHGNNILVDVIVLVNKHLNVVESHDITEEIERRMEESHNIRYVHVHIEPKDS